MLKKHTLKTVPHLVPKSPLIAIFQQRASTQAVGRKRAKRPWSPARVSFTALLVLALPLCRWPARPSSQSIHRIDATIQIPNARRNNYAIYDKKLFMKILLESCFALC